MLQALVGHRLLHLVRRQRHQSDEQTELVLRIDHLLQALAWGVQPVTATALVQEDALAGELEPVLLVGWPEPALHLLDEPAKQGHPSARSWPAVAGSLAVLPSVLASLRFWVVV